MLFNAHRLLGFYNLLPLVISAGVPGFVLAVVDPDDSVVEGVYQDPDEPVF